MADKGKPDLSRLIDQLASAEQDFLRSDLLAPILPGGRVRVRLDGLLYEFAVEQHGQAEIEPGFAILKPIDRQRARIVSRPKRKAVEAYLALFPAVRLILAEAPLPIGDPPRVVPGTPWLALPARGGTQRVQVDGVVPVQLVEDVGRFDTVLARFDGASFFFAGRDKRRDRAMADYLRAALAQRVAPEALQKSGLTKHERAAYAFALPRELERERFAEAQTQEGRLRQALRHAGAELNAVVEKRDHLQVSWTVDGKAFTSAVNKQDHGVIVAGICLSGQDRRFDLASLVGVMRQRGARHAPRIGQGGMPVDQYFNVHPEED